MAYILLIAAAVIILCVIWGKISSKAGVPVLLAFILLGMLFGSDGIFKIHFDDFSLANSVCSAALIFIMFYGGFGTNYKRAKPVLAKAVALSAGGTVLTAAFVCLFCFLALKISLPESFLIGAVISSTDAASVFSILRSKKLGLKDGTDSLLEIESGSNDPFSYMLTLLALSFMEGKTGGGFIYMIFSQTVFGALGGIITAAAALLFLKYFKISSSGFKSIFFLAIGLLSFALPELAGGNGYLSAYIAGIILGNRKIDDKAEIVHFFDGLTGLSQMLLFFLLGLLSFPSELPSVALPALLIALFLTFVARPGAVFIILSLFKCRVNQMALISFAGMRGAASIVFAISAALSSAQNDIFNMVFFIVLFSILFQGSLIPRAAKLLHMTDETVNVMKTFNDYIDEEPVQFIKVSIPAGHSWDGALIKNLSLPPELLIALILRGNEKIIPRGKTQLCKGDEIVLFGKAADREDGVSLSERTLGKDSELIGKTPKELSDKREFILLIKRDGKVIIPKGSTRFLVNDSLIFTNSESAEINF